MGLSFSGLGAGHLYCVWILSKERVSDLVMVYIEDFDTWAEQAMKLFNMNPKARFTQKYRGEDKIVVLKVTDDKICLKHKLKVARNMKKLDAFNAQWIRSC